MFWGSEPAGSDSYNKNVTLCTLRLICCYDRAATSPSPPVIILQPPVKLVLTCAPDWSADANVNSLVLKPSCSPDIIIIKLQRPFFTDYCVCANLQPVLQEPELAFTGKRIEFTVTRGSNQQCAEAALDEREEKQTARKDYPLFRY